MDILKKIDKKCKGSYRLVLRALFTENKEDGREIDQKSAQTDAEV